MLSLPRIAAYIPAGQRPGFISPLAKFAHVTNKALVPLNGRPLISYPLQAVDGLQKIEEIYIVGLNDPGLGQDFDHQISFVPSSGDRLSTVMAAVKHALSLASPPDYLMNIAADLPFLTTSALEALLREIDWSSQPDCVIPIVAEKTMAQQFPSFRKHFKRFAEGKFSPCDVLLFRPGLLVQDNVMQAVNIMVNYRKKWPHVFSRFSCLGMLKYLSGTLSIWRDICPFIEQRYCVRIQVLVVGDACMRADLDYPKDIPFFDNRLRAVAAQQTMRNG